MSQKEQTSKTSKNPSHLHKAPPSLYSAIKPETIYRMPRGFPTLMHYKYRKIPPFKSLYPSSVPPNLNFPTHTFQETTAVQPSSNKSSSPISHFKSIPKWCHPSRFVRLWNSSKYLNMFDTLIFDIDGVLCKGGHFFPGVIKVLNNLISTNKTLLFATNNAAIMPNQLSDVFKQQGLYIPPTHIVTSAAVSVWHLKQFLDASYQRQILQEKLSAEDQDSSTNNDTTNAISGDGDEEEGENEEEEGEGVDLNDIPAQPDSQENNALLNDLFKYNVPPIAQNDSYPVKVPPSLLFYGPNNKALLRILQEQNLPITAVSAEQLYNFDSTWLSANNIVGVVSTSRQPIMPTEELNKNLAEKLLSNNIHFFITAPDVYVPCSIGTKHNYDMSAACTDSNCLSHKATTLLGKPNNYMGSYLQQYHQINPQSTLMIGDGIMPDVLFGNKQQFSTLLVFSGNVESSKFLDYTPYVLEQFEHLYSDEEKAEYNEKLDDISEMCKPDFVTNSVLDLLNNNDVNSSSAISTLKKQPYLKNKNTSISVPTPAISAFSPTTSIGRKKGKDINNTYITDDF